MFFQNVHLVQKWLSTLEKKLEKYGEESHDNYRVFISAEPAALPEYHIIPQGILEAAIKITNEPPTGMFANLHKALDNFDQVICFFLLELSLLSLPSRVSFQKYHTTKIDCITKFYRSDFDLWILFTVHFVCTRIAIYFLENETQTALNRKSKDMGYPSMTQNQYVLSKKHT